MIEGTNGGGGCQQNAAETGQVRYGRLNRAGETLIATAVFNKDGPYRFYQTDGWEVVPWDFTPSPAEIAFVKGLFEETNRDRTQRAEFNACQALDEDLAYQLLTVPNVFQEGFSSLKQMARTIAIEQQLVGRFLNSLGELQAFDERGRQLVDEFLDVKRRVRHWLIEIAELESSWWTFDERMDGPAVAVAIAVT